MACDYEVFRVPFISKVGEAILVLVANAPAGSTRMMFEWYLLVRLHRDELAFFDHGVLRIDTAPNPDDVSNWHAMTADEGRAGAIGLAKNAFAGYQGSLAKDESDATFVEADFEAADPVEIHKLLIAGAGRKQIAEMKEMTKCQEFRLFLLEALARYPERTARIENPYADEQA